MLQIVTVYDIINRLNSYFMTYFDSLLHPTTAEVEIANKLAIITHILLP